MQEATKTADPPETVAPDVPETGQALVTTQEFTRAIMSPSDAKAEMGTYIAIVDAVLSPDDYSKIGNKQYKRKSGWRKLAKVFAVGDEIVNVETIRDSYGRPTFAAFQVKAIDPTGRSTIGYHEAHLSEKCCPTIYGDTCPKARWDNHDCCRTSCTGYVHWSLPGNLPATAHTRAKNRAIADLIGAGEVSAEEMEIVGVEDPRPHRGKGRKPPTEATPARGGPRRAAKPRATLENEADQIRASRVETDNGDRPWRCAKCKDERAIPAKFKDCPYCGHLRGSKMKAPKPAETPAAASEETPPSEQEEPAEAKDEGPTALTKEELQAEQAEQDGRASTAEGEAAEEAEAIAGAEADEPPPPTEEG